MVIQEKTWSAAIAGPRVLEHMVDCVLYFEGDRHHTFRVLRAVKNRFGSTNEIGIFIMEAAGLLEVENPSKLLLGERPAHAVGSVITATVEGTRPVLVEVQALLCDTVFGVPRRRATGLDQNRVAMIMAVLEKRVGAFLGQQDAYVNVVGGIRVSEPAVDLATALAIYSSLRGIPVVSDLMILGEVGLTGEVRSVSQIEARLNEAEKLGFGRAIIPAGNYRNLHDSYRLQIEAVNTVQQAIEYALGR